VLCSEEVFNKAFIKKNKNEKLIKYFKRSSSNEDEIRKLRQENDELIKIINERNLVTNNRGTFSFNRDHFWIGRMRLCHNGCLNSLTSPGNPQPPSWINYVHKNTRIGQNEDGMRLHDQEKVLNWQKCTRLNWMKSKKITKMNSMITRNRSMITRWRQMIITGAFGAFHWTRKDTEFICPCFIQLHSLRWPWTEFERSTSYTTYVCDWFWWFLYR